MIGVLLTDVEPPTTEQTPAELAAPPFAIAEPSKEARVGLEQLAFLVGGTWVARIDKGGTTITLEETCTWSEKRQQIRTVVLKKLGGKVQQTARGGFGWAPLAGRLASYAISDQGGLHFGLEIEDEGPGWRFEVYRIAQSVLELEVGMRQVQDDVMLLTQKHGPGEPLSVRYVRAR